ncbi:DUF4880 domain-containing protein [Alcaligenaceae bacterium SJ-26]|nr:DUF4880 domain-containing protein [Alcaligenaceae bacterium SJ-26]
MTTPHAVAEQAIQWLLALQENPGSASLLGEWQAWHDANPAHAQAWQRIATLHGRLQGIQHTAPASAGAARNALLTRPANPRRRAMAGSLALLLSGGLGWLAYDSQPGQRLLAQERTRKGEQRQRHLEDGTTLTLAPDTALNIHYDNQMRVIELLAGEIFVETGHATGDLRPFMVRTRHGLAQALGTRYSVRLLPSAATTSHPATQVSVFEGRVRLQASQAGTTDSQPYILESGEQSVMHPDRYDLRQPADAGRASWPDGILLARDMRLADLLHELGAYAPFELDCAPALADLRLSGSYPLAAPEDAIYSLARMLHLKVEDQRRGLIWTTRTFYLS